MRYTLSLVAVALCVLMSGCGAENKVNEIPQTDNTVQSLAESGEKAKKLIAVRTEERRKRGDTLIMPYQELQKYLPAEVSGYTAQAPEGKSTNNGDGPFTSANRSYINAQGETVMVTIIDYVATPDMLDTYVELSNSDLLVANRRGDRREFDTGIEYSSGWEQYKKRDKSAEVNYVLGGRFLLSVETPNQPDTKFARDIASSMPLKELAAK